MISELFFNWMVKGHVRSIIKREVDVVIEGKIDKMEVEILKDLIPYLKRVIDLRKTDVEKVEKNIILRSQEKIIASGLRYLKKFNFKRKNEIKKR